MDGFSNRIRKFTSYCGWKIQSTKVESMMKKGCSVNHFVLKSVAENVLHVGSSVSYGKIRYPLHRYCIIKNAQISQEPIPYTIAFSK